MKVQVLAEDLAKPLREKMGSTQYTDVLLATCFQETVDATKVNGERRTSCKPGWQIQLVYCTVFPVCDYSHRCPPPLARLQWPPTLLAELMRLLLPLVSAAVR